MTRLPWPSLFRIPALESIGCPNRVLQNRPPTFIYEGVDIDAQPEGMKAGKSRPGLTFSGQGRHRVGKTLTHKNDDDDDRSNDSHKNVYPLAFAYSDINHQSGSFLEATYFQVIVQR
jgi:hypothetical protein